MKLLQTLLLSDVEDESETESEKEEDSEEEEEDTSSEEDALENLRKHYVKV